MIPDSVERASGAFQQPLTEAQITAMARRALGGAEDVITASYNVLGAA
jgi:hypothetical protein